MELEIVLVRLKKSMNSLPLDDAVGRAMFKQSQVNGKPKPWTFFSLLRLIGFRFYFGT